MCSPVLHKMICGSFIESFGRLIEVQDVEGVIFGKVLDLWCGKEIREVKKFNELLELGSVADRFQITGVASVIEEAIIGELSVERCGDVLGWGGGTWLGRAEEAARKLAVEQFEEVAATGGFLRMSEGIVESFLEEDELGVDSEEAVFEAAVAWIKARDGSSLRGRGLLRAVRFPLMQWDYLRDRVSEMVGGWDGGWILDVVEEALLAKAAMRDGLEIDLRLLGPKAMVRRVRRGVRWEEYADKADGGGRRLLGKSSSHLRVSFLAACEGRVCSGSINGTIRVWNAASLEEERVLIADQDDPGIWSLAAWEGRAISGHADGRVRVWSPLTGECEQVLQGHTEAVLALAVQGSRLMSGSADQSIAIWVAGAGAPWARERTLRGHAGGIWALAPWRDKLISASADGTVRVWDAGTGAHDATLAGHGGPVYSVAVDGDRVYSISRDGTIRVWAAGTWGAVRVVRGCAESEEFLRCMVVSGGRLVTGSDGSRQCEVCALPRWRAPARVVACACACVCFARIQAHVGCEGETARACACRAAQNRGPVSLIRRLPPAGARVGPADARVRARAEAAARRRRRRAGGSGRGGLGRGGEGGGGLGASLTERRGGYQTCARGARRATRARIRPAQARLRAVFAERARTRPRFRALRALLPPRRGLRCGLHGRVGDGRRAGGGAADGAPSGDGADARRSRRHQTGWGSSTGCI